MKRRVLIILLAGTLSLMSMGAPCVADARVDVNIVLPPLVFSGPPDVVVIPGTYAYFVPGVEADVFFYQGYWYRPHRGYWFRASSYRGPWGRIAVGRVPRVLIDVPPDFRRVSPGFERIPYGHLRRNWRAWERDRHWDRHDEWRRHREMREERERHRDDRGGHDHGGEGHRGR
jgi:hypothetical protein